jgi:hypothetical protein
LLIFPKSQIPCRAARCDISFPMRGLAEHLDMLSSPAPLY